MFQNNIKNVIFIDSSVPDGGHIIDAINSDSVVFFLNNKTDGIEQMRQILLNYTDLNSIQIISHGSDGALYLSGKSLNSENIFYYSAQLSQIGQSLSKSGDILLFGCDISRSIKGKYFVDYFAQLTNSEVAASTNLSGLGGDWDLEYQSGKIESKYNISSMYYHTLAQISSNLDQILNGTPGDDRIIGRAGPNTLIGGDGNDYLYDQDGFNSLNGGAGDDTLSTNTEFTALIGGNGYDTAYLYGATGVVIDLASCGIEFIVAGSGSDTIDGSGQTVGVTIYGNAGNDTITGSNYADKLEGQDGDDVLVGGAGNDTLGMAGLANGNYRGNDTLIGGDGNDVLDDRQGLNSLNGGDGDDTLSTNTEFTALIGGAGYDKATLEGSTGNTIDLSACGIEWISAGGGNDTIDGSGQVVGVTINGNAGNDTITGSSYVDNLQGGVGNDNLVGGSGNDVISGGSGNNSLSGGAGIDTISYSLEKSDISVNLLILDEQDTGVSFDKISGIEGVIGGLGNDTLIGDDFNNNIDGNKGSDIMIGGLGNDKYYVDSLTDIVIEDQNEGSDTVISSTSYVLPDNVERLEFTGSFSSSAVGNGLDNIIVGNAGSNFINGRDGIDTVSFEKSNKAISVSLVSGIATGDGTDTLKNVENIVGSIFNDFLNGDARSNVINGSSGADSMDGAGGSDIYIVAATADHGVAEIKDTGATGIDEVRFTSTTANTTLTLYAGDVGIETAVIGTGTAAEAVTTGVTALKIDASALTTGITLIGNAGANTLTGGSGDDRLQGGAGNDLLKGGNGIDSFIFDRSPNGTSNKDTIADFVSGTDKLVFSKAVFTGLSSADLGGLTTDAFWSGAGVNTAHDATDRFIYNTTTGALWYDADGTGSAASVQVAILSGNPALAFADLQIIA